MNAQSNENSPSYPRPHTLFNKCQFLVAQFEELRSLLNESNSQTSLNLITTQDLDQWQKNLTGIINRRKTISHAIEMDMLGIEGLLNKERQELTKKLKGITEKTAVESPKGNKQTCDLTKHALLQLAPVFSALDEMWICDSILIESKESQSNLKKIVIKKNTEDMECIRNEFEQKLKLRTASAQASVNIAKQAMVMDVERASRLIHSKIEEAEEKQQLLSLAIQNERLLQALEQQVVKHILKAPLEFRQKLLVILKILQGTNRDREILQRLLAVDFLDPNSMKECDEIAQELGINF